MAKKIFTPEEIKERKKAQRLAWATKNIDRINARRRARRAERTEDQRVLDSIARKKDREAYKENEEAYRKDYYAKNREKILGNLKIKNADPARKERVSKYNAEYTKRPGIKDREKKRREIYLSKPGIRLRIANYYRERPPEVKQRNRDRKIQWLAENRDLDNLASQRRRDRIMAAGGTLSQGITTKLLISQGGLCKYCRTNLFKSGIHLDHRMPLALGGAHADWNMQLLCPRCNRRKSAKHPDDYEREIGLK